MALKTPSSGSSADFKFNNFDLLRLFAATQVVLSHSAAHLDIARPSWWQIIEAFPGVPIFFVISGFLISASYERTSSVRAYARNRILRIYPGLWCCIFVTVAVAGAFGFAFDGGRALAWLGAQLVGLIYTPQFLKSFGFGSYNGSLWTIPIELQFYLLLPILYAIIRRPSARSAYLGAFLLFFVAVAIATNRSFQPLAEVLQEPLGQKVLRYSFIPHFYLFLAGVVLQRVSAQHSRWVVGKGLHWLAAYLAIHFLIPNSAVTYVVATMTLGVAVVAIAYTRPRLSEHVLRGNDISYGVYIYHGLLLNIFVQLGLTGQYKFLIAVLLLTYPVAYLSWLLVERPLLRRKKQTIHATPAATLSTRS
jgi:peptidoglycan/LPS O-acetylase OafA/YrhL